MAAAGSGIPLVAVFLLAFLLVAAPEAAQALTCGSVTSLLAPCIPYTRGKGPLTSSCCGGVRQLAGAANTPTDRQTACKCLKTVTGSISGINPGIVSGIPGKCGVSVPYPISPSTDCSKVH